MDSAPDTGVFVDIEMPQMGVSVVEGTIVSWLKQPGDEVHAEEPVLEITTDKIDIEIPAPADGQLAEILVAAGETVDVGTVLGRIATPGMSDAPIVVHDRRHRYTPVVQRIAAEHGIDLASVAGTGRDGRVRKQDVEAAVAASIGSSPPANVEPADADSIGSSPPANSRAAEPPMHIESPYRPDPVAAAVPEGGTLSRMRRTIGEHMKRSLHEAATCTSWIEVDMSRIEHARRELQTTALPHIARCAIGALREHPELNAWLEGERHTVHPGVQLGIAVSLGADGLVVPVVRDAHELSAEGLAARIADLARRARDRELAPDDVHGGTFTITNPGQYGTIMATPVINQPQVAILDVEAVVKRPVVVTDEHGADAIAIRPMCVFGLSWDHRALDGVLAAQFLAALKRRAEAYEG